MEERLPEKRIRLTFTGRGLLNKEQRSDGLKRCWVLIHPSTRTISDLAHYIHRSFHFDHACPDALVFSDGDIIAYRLIELSSSWCPDLSSFRAGKVSSYSPDSTVITLVPVMDYPLTFHQEQQEHIGEYSGSTSLYKEDGSLEIEFESLIDILLLNREKGNQLPTCTANENIADSNASATCIQERVSVGVSKSRDEKMQTLPQENGHRTSWDEINRVLNEKKAELSKQADACVKKGDSVKGPWSYKSLRRSALGPTISLLRSEKNL